ncbi:hypothetical protein D9619_003102 [Psilocybe cf. subviscida]|uniref:Copper-fist domain-containing protein n=1 Tax=Psilocybe cf. subviscida TaxID=2480587 RepID=A0A8H5EUT2_9AGAR|nr:hypothetical protein D9619_003102 [Psilocybe cf. subviscida]
MVYVNSKKFACESCIKGHRSSSCHHTDRPLFEIKKKGRPVSQCTKCRELRQSKKFHSKCTCNHQAEEAPAMQPLAASSNSKTRRFIPIVPALPNGLRDVLEGSSSIPVPADSRQRVDSLLNPCDCKSLWKCKCREASQFKPTHTPNASARASSSTDALSTLANAAVAVSCCAPPTPSPTSKVVPGPTEKDNINKARRRPGSPLLPPTKRHKARKPNAMPSPGPALAPLLYLSSPPSTSSSSPMMPRPMPDFPTMTIPPMSEITSLAGSGCTCGIRCGCPGCVEHRGPTHVNEEHQDCADGCGTCIDESMGTALPGVSNDQPSGSSFLDRFFARAAALPPPPSNRRMTFDPMDTTVYSPTSWQADPFGPVNLPKLECCGGQCNCPDGQCSCRTSCAGCCDPADNQRHSHERASMTPLPFIPVQQQTQGSCCG